MNAAPLSSPRLQRVLRVLRAGRSVTTRTIVRRASVCAVNAIMAELREHGAEIHCEVRRDPKTGARRWYYTMTKEPREK